MLRDKIFSIWEMRKNTEWAPVFLWHYFAFLALLALLVFLILVPYSFYWLYKDGDLALERVVKAQAQGKFVIFGSAISQNFIEYKLELYKNIRPDICVIGSSRVMQFRGAWFDKPFVNMGGVAGNLAELRYTIEQILRISPPRAMLIGLDFWWFMPQWEKEPLKPLDYRGASYNYDFQKLKKPWQWLLEGKISLGEFLRPLGASFSRDFRPDRYGILAQQYSEGFGPDGSWYNTAELTGKKPPFDYQFSDTLEQIDMGIKAFFHAQKDQHAPSPAHIQAFMEILRLLNDKNIEYWLFIPPLSQKAFDQMARNRRLWPHLFDLQKSLARMGLDVPDFSSPKSLESDDCEFIDGFHGGEIAYARLLLALAKSSPKLLYYINMERLVRLVRDWQGHAMSFNINVSVDPEIDFNNFGCPKKLPPR